LRRRRERLEPAHGVGSLSRRGSAMAADVRHVAGDGVQVLEAEGRESVGVATPARAGGTPIIAPRARGWAARAGAAGRREACPPFGVGSFLLASAFDARMPRRGLGTGLRALARSRDIARSGALGTRVRGLDRLAPFATPFGSAHLRLGLV